MSSKMLKTLGVKGAGKEKKKKQKEEKKRKAEKEDSSSSSSSDSSDSENEGPSGVSHHVEEAAEEELLEERQPEEEPLLPLWTEAQRQEMEAKLAAKPPKKEDVRDYYEDPEVGLYAATVEFRPNLQELYPATINWEKFGNAKEGGYEPHSFQSDDFDASHLLFPPEDFMFEKSRGEDPLSMGKFLYALPDRRQASGYRLVRPVFPLAQLATGPLKVNTNKSGAVSGYKMRSSLKPYRGGVPFDPLTPEEIRDIRMWQAKVAGIEAIFRQIVELKSDKYEGINDVMKGNYFDRLDEVFYPMTHTKWTMDARKEFLGKLKTTEDPNRQKKLKKDISAIREPRIQAKIFPLGDLSKKPAWMRPRFQGEPSDPNLRMIYYAPVKGTNNVTEVRDAHPLEILGSDCDEKMEGQMRARHAVSGDLELSALVLTPKSVSFQFQVRGNLLVTPIQFSQEEERPALDKAPATVRNRFASIVCGKRSASEIKQEEEEGEDQAAEGEEPGFKRAHTEEEDKVEGVYD